ncbi:unnamed protein product [Aphanomyces euteiches]
MSDIVAVLPDGPPSFCAFFATSNVCDDNLILFNSDFDSSWSSVSFKSAAATSKSGAPSADSTEIEVNASNPIAPTKRTPAVVASAMDLANTVKWMAVCITVGLIHPPTPLTARCTANCKFEPLRFALDDAPPPIALLDVMDIAIIQSLLLDGGASDYADKATETKCEAKLSLLHELPAGATTTPSTVYFAV